MPCVKGSNSLVADFLDRQSALSAQSAVKFRSVHGHSFYPDRIRAIRGHPPLSVFRVIRGPTMSGLSVNRFRFSVLDFRGNLRSSDFRVHSCDSWAKFRILGSRSRRLHPCPFEPSVVNLLSVRSQSILQKLAENAKIDPQEVDPELLRSSAPSPVKFLV